jgi:hypothetical protein
MRKPICDTRYHGATTQRKSEHLAVRMVSNFLCASCREDVYLRSTCAMSALKAPGAHFNPGLSEKIERAGAVNVADVQEKHLSAPVAKDQRSTL